MDTVTFQGKGTYNRFVTPNKYNKWSTRFYFDQPSLEKFRELRDDGVLTQLHKNEDGYYADLGRPVFKEYKDKHGGTRRIDFTPPIVLSRDGVTPFKDDIGDGSDLTVEMEVYPYTIPSTNGKKGKAIRINSVRVDNLVPFNPKTNLTANEQKAVAGINQVEPQPQF